ncbi:hypothetical protein R1flu_019673 [Riccia fluitans]|uniref:RRM domain-containing protein n=1 Tax=Riccia fluitans TaxID=41844 RepID=A0ABD1ZKR6_9MARC
MSTAQVLRRAAAPLRSCAARYLRGDAASSSNRFDAQLAAAAAVDLRVSQCVWARRLSTEADSGLESQTQPSADQGSSLPTPTPQQTSVPRLILQRTGDPASAGAGEPASLHISPSDGTQKVAARITNASKNILKSDIRYIQLSFNSMETFRLAQRTVSMKGRFGGRYLKLTQEEAQMDETNALINQFRGRSLLMNNVPTTVGSEDVERFFSGYSLDSNFPIKYIPQMQPPPAMKRFAATQTKQEADNRVLYVSNSNSTLLKKEFPLRPFLAIEGSVTLYE